MFDTVDRIREELDDLVSSVDPDTLDGPRARRLFDAAVAIEQRAGALRLLVTRRLEECNAWQREGDRTAAHFVARTTGTSVRQAVDSLQTARRMDPHGGLADALRAGEVTAAQAAPIAEAVAADPDAENELLARASTDNVQALRDECRRVKAAARTDELDHDDRIRRSRFLRTWTDHDGAGRGEWKLPPEAQARILARLAAETDVVATEAKAAGAPTESREAYAADALVRVADADGGSGRSRVAIHLRVDHSAFERGYTEPGEICEIEGIGPVPVATARNLSTDALIYVLATKGTDITRYAKHGRYIPDKLRLALEARDPVCRELGCNVRDNLEIHHVDPVDNQGETSMKNCCRLCRWHHYLCTHHGWTVEPTADGRFELRPPPGRASPDDRSPPDELRLAM
jgi:Domain of unknown function (DUF222)